MSFQAKIFELEWRFFVGYFFHKRGYDVWFGNARANTYSRNHTHLSPDDGEFWKFSWHEIGLYDLPAMIDFILEKTEQDQMIYIGHSQGKSKQRCQYSQLLKFCFNS